MAKGFIVYRRSEAGWRFVFKMFWVGDTALGEFNKASARLDKEHGAFQNKIKWNGCKSKADPRDLADKYWVAPARSMDHNQRAAGFPAGWHLHLHTEPTLSQDWHEETSAAAFELFQLLLSLQRDAKPRLRLERFAAVHECVRARSQVNISKL